MNSKKRPAASKRAKLPLLPDYARQFEKDWDTLNASGQFDMEALKDVMLHLIADRGPLPPERKDHTLEGGKWKGDRECHISGDFLLIYRYVPAKNPTKILFVRTGTHPQLFGR